MKNYLLPLMVSAMLLGGCSAAYKTGQTPDDVYYSSGPVVRAEVSKKTTQPTDEYASYWGNPEDDYLRMKVRNRNRWSEIDNFNYWNNFNSLSMMGAFNNPCCCNPGFWNNGFGGFNNFNTWNYGWNYNAWNYNAWNTGWGFGGLGFNNWGNNNYWNRPVVYYPGKDYNANRNTFRPSSLGVFKGTQFDRGTNSGNLLKTNSSSGGQLFRSIFSGSSNSSGNNGGSGILEKAARSFGTGSGSSSGSSSGGSSSGGSSRSSGGGSSSGSSSGGGRGGRGG